MGQFPLEIENDELRYRLHQLRIGKHLTAIKGLVAVNQHDPAKNYKLQQVWNSLGAQNAKLQQQVCLYESDIATCGKSPCPQSG